MYNIAIIECSDRVIEILKGNFLNEFKTPARCFKSFNDASEELKENDFQLVVCRNICEEEEESAKLLLNHLYDSGKATKVIVLGDLEQSGFEFETLSDRFRVEELNRKAVRLLGISKEELVEMKLPDYIPFPLYHFYLMSTVPCDIYIRIGKEGQDEKYVKRIHSENEFDKHAIKKYEGSGLKCFYVHKDQRRLFMNSLVTQTLAKIDSYTENEDIVDAISDSYEIAKDLAVTTGIDSHSAILIDGTLESMTKVVDANPKFVQLFSTLVKYRGTVSYRHSYLIMIFAKKVLSKLTWAADDIVDDLYSSLVFLSFFHDIFLADDKLIKINSKEDLSNTELSEEESDLVHNHANLAATLVQKMPRAPSGIDILIRQHHGTSNGVGFTNAHTSSISKLSIVFIVLETFVWRLLNFKKGEESMSTLFVDLEKEFMLPSYREVVVALKASIIS